MPDEVSHGISGEILPVSSSGGPEQQEQPKVPKARRVPVASIHSHFNIFRDVNVAHEGDVTLAEQIKALQRFVRWHTRQVEVGKQLLADLVKREGAPL